MSTAPVELFIGAYSVIFSLSGHLLWLMYASSEDSGKTVPLQQNIMFWTNMEINVKNKFSSQKYSEIPL